MHLHRHIIHTVGPRYNVKYRTAAESALHSCYRSTLEQVKEARLGSVAIAPINSLRRGYPPEAGAHMALRMPLHIPRRAACPATVAQRHGLCMYPQGPSVGS
jgi:O-acetyl-ADP-ribose deacetylase (regulator of RNase III)